MDPTVTEREEESRSWLVMIFSLLIGLVKRWKRWKRSMWSLVQMKGDSSLQWQQQDQRRRETVARLWDKIEKKIKEMDQDEWLLEVRKRE